MQTGNLFGSMWHIIMENDFGKEVLTIMWEQTSGIKSMYVYVQHIL